MIFSVISLLSKKITPACRKAAEPSPKVKVPVSSTKPSEQSSKNDMHPKSLQIKPRAVAENLLTGTYPPPKTGYYFCDPDVQTSKKTDNSSLNIFSIPSANRIANDICTILDIPMGRLKCSSFQDGEAQITLHDSVNEEKCYLIASSPKSTAGPLNVHKAVMETLFSLSAMKREGARDVCVVFPYFPYFRSHNKGSPDKAVANGAADIARLLAELGA